MSANSQSPRTPFRDVMNVPNQITSARLLLSVVLFVFLAYEWYLIGFVLFIIAASTDWIDGYISDNFAVWQRTGSGPGFNVGYADGMRLRDMLGRGQRVTVALRVESAMVPGLTAASVWGTLPGTTDEEVLVIAHMDGYFRAALDNASGARGHDRAGGALREPTAG